MPAVISPALRSNYVALNLGITFVDRFGKAVREVISHVFFWIRIANSLTCAHALFIVDVASLIESPVYVQQ